MRPIRWKAVGTGVIIIMCTDPVPGKKIPLQTSGGIRSGAILSRHAKHFSAAIYGFLNASFSLQINPILNVVVMIPAKNPCTKTNSQIGLYRL